MSFLELLGFMLALTGGRPSDGVCEYARAIQATSANGTEMRVLALIGWKENTFHLHSSELPFGVVDYHQQHPNVVVTVARGASVALSAFRFIRDVRCPGYTLGSVLGRYHHGMGDGRRGGCYVDMVSASQTVRLNWPAARVPPGLCGERCSSYPEGGVDSSYRR